VSKVNAFPPLSGKAKSWHSEDCCCLSCHVSPVVFTVAKAAVWLQNTMLGVYCAIYSVQRYGEMCWQSGCNVADLIQWHMHKITTVPTARICECFLLDIYRWYFWTLAIVEWYFLLDVIKQLLIVSLLWRLLYNVTYITQYTWRGWQPASV